jgi:hypothetical protein
MNEAKLNVPKTTVKAANKFANEWFISGVGPAPPALAHFHASIK